MRDCIVMGLSEAVGTHKALLQQSIHFKQSLGGASIISAANQMNGSFAIRVFEGLLLRRL